jgi:GNAT superfamily N-acetyltransferase
MLPRIVPAVASDAPLLLEMIREFAEYEKLAHTVTATEERLRETLFGPKPAAETILAYCDEECAGFAVYFHTYSTFLAEPGLYLEDVYVKPHLRGKRIGLAFLNHLAKVATERGYKRIEWGVLNWNKPAIQFYRKLGAIAMDDWTKYRLEGEALKDLALIPGIPEVSKGKNSK